jgi:hypothetical protein
LGTSRNQAFRTVETAIESPLVRAAAILGGTDVIVRIIRSGVELASDNVVSQDVSIGSVTIVPDAGVNFGLNLSGRRLILNRGYKLQGFSITSGDPSGAAAAIEIRAGGTPLKDMVIDCTGIDTSGAGGVGGGDKCVHVPSSVSGTVTLENVNITIPSDKGSVTGILHEGSGTLKVTNGSSVVALGSGSAKGVVGIYGKTTSGSVEVVGSTVSLSAITATGGNVFAVLLSGPSPSGSIASGRVQGSSIQVREGSSTSTIAIGVCVKASSTSGTVTVQGNNFTNAPSGSTSIAIYKQAGTVVPAPIASNTFNGFSTPPPPSSERRYVESGYSCP